MFFHTIDAESTNKSKAFSPLLYFHYTLYKRGTNTYQLAVLDYIRGNINFSLLN